MEQPTDLDLVTDHPFQPMRDGWEDTCGHLDPDGWTCGYLAAEHGEVPRAEHLEACILPRPDDPSCGPVRERYGGLCPEHDGLCADDCPVTGGGWQVYDALEGASRGGEAIEP